MSQQAISARQAVGRARPVWLSGREREMNVHAGFVCRFPVRQAKSLRFVLTGSTFYRVFLNGKFVHYGPARGPHGYVRIDVCDLTPHVSPPDGRAGGVEGVIAVEVAGYYCSSYYTIRIPSFLQAEVLQDGQAICATGHGDAFRAFPLKGRLQKVMRYSFQRPFSEVYALDNADPQARWTTHPVPDAETPSVVSPNVDYLPREVPAPAFDVVLPKAVLETGAACKISHPPGFKHASHRFIDAISENVHGYPLTDIVQRPFETLQDYIFAPGSRGLTAGPRSAAGDLDLTLHEGEYVLLDMGLNNNGFIQSVLTAHEDSEALVFFDEKLIDGRIQPRSWSSVNVVKYALKRSAEPYVLESFETYGYRYIQYFVTKGKVTLRRAALREYSCPEFRNTSFQCEDERVAAVFGAAVETYRQNTLDVFMDCPTRERAGWLCDSYFTAQSAQYFSGNAVVEKVMLENFVRAKGFPGLPAGMLPMCYPADHPNGVFIPQWAMWYVVELEGYLKRAPDVGGTPDADRETFRKVCLDLIGFLNRYRNSDGLLERLPSWNFVEWSDANKWVQDVNYPTNMLYARVLDLVGDWFDPALKDQAKAIRAKVVEQSFNGRHFADNAVRRPDGRLVVTGNASEICQYFAFFFGTAEPSDSRFAPLADLVLNTFGPERKAKGIMPEIAYANAFIGNYLRMEILLRWRRYDQIIRETLGYFHKMAALTGTLWEHDSITGSLNHGFASYAGVVIIKCLLGIQEIDLAARTVTLDFGDAKIAAAGEVGTPFGAIAVRREVKDGRVRIEYSVPKQFNSRISLAADDIALVER